MSIRLSCCALGLLVSLNVSAQICNSAMLASTPDARFIDNGDGTVTDQQTRLTWKRCLEGLSGNDCSQGTMSLFQWSEALQHAAAQDGAWRLPNVKELLGIIEFRCREPSINLSVFPNTPPNTSAGITYVWSNSPSLVDGYNAENNIYEKVPSAHVVTFSYPYLSERRQTGLDPIPIRLVRDAE